MTEFEQKSDIEATLAAIKGLDLSDLIKVMKHATMEAEKRQKSQKTTKKGSMPKGVDPPQLKKPRAWVDFTRQHAQENGWEPFTIIQSKKDKTTGEKTIEEIEMPGSMLHQGVHVFEGSIDAKNPNGKMLIHKHAMSLSKQRWAPKDSKGTHQALYDEFMSTYEITDSQESNESLEAKEKEKVASKEAKELEKAAAKEAKELEKAAAKEAKEKEKAAAKEAKEKEKAATKEAKGKTSIPKAAIAVVNVTTPKIAKKAATKVTAWSCPDDDRVHYWNWKGKDFMRNFQNEVWTRGADGEIDKWQGMYLPEEDRIDDSIEEPVFAD